MKVSSVIVFFLGFTIAYGTPCEDLTGTWRNQLGSNMTIQITPGTSKITGRYYTSVESSTGASRISSDVTGLVQPVEGGSLLTFHVLWNNGRSITAWTGQCLPCDGKERIYTTWVLRSLQDARNRWMSTRINEDTFWRVNDEVGQSVAQDSAAGASNPDFVEDWESTAGDSIHINSASNGIFEGSENGNPIYGRFASNETYVAFGVATVTEQEAKGAAGHIYDPQNPDTRSLEKSWLSYGFSNECAKPRKYVKFGMDFYFKKTENAA